MHYSTSQIEIKNPFRPAGYAMIMLGIATIIIALIKIAQIASTNLDALDNGSLFILIQSLAVLGIFFWGCSICVSALKRLGKLTITGEHPPGLLHNGTTNSASYSSISETLQSGELRSMQIPRSMEIAHRLLGSRIPYLSPHKYAFVEQCIKFARSVIKIITGITILTFLKIIFDIDFSFSFLWTFIITLIVISSVRIYAIILMMNGEKSPPTQSFNATVSLPEAGDHFYFPIAMDNTAQNLFTGKTAYRTWKTGFSEVSGEREKVNRFLGDWYLETRPVPDDPPKPTAAYLLLIAGVILAAVAIILLTTEAYLGDPYSNIIDRFLWLKFQGSMFLVIATSLFRQAHILLGTLRFTSFFIHVNVQGTQQQHLFKSGSARDDTFTAKIASVRSKAQVGISVACLHTENFNLTTQRQLVGFSSNEEVINIGKEIQQGVMAFGIISAPFGAEIDTPSFRSMTEKNHLYRTAVTSGHPLPPKGSASMDLPSLNPADTPESMSSGPDQVQTPSPDSVDEMKRCIECAELIQGAAIKCRYCGYRYDSPLEK